MIEVRCLALASNREHIERTTLPVRGVDGFVDETRGPVLDIDRVPTESLRSHIADALELLLEDARRMDARNVVLVLGHRSSWTNEDLIAVDLGILDGSSPRITNLRNR